MDVVNKNNNDSTTNNLNLNPKHLARDFELLLTENGNWLILYARSLGIRDPGEAVHDVFVSIWLRMNSGARIYDPASYLATTLRNLAIKLKNRNQLTISLNTCNNNHDIPATESWFANTKSVRQKSASAADQFYPDKQQIQNAVSELNEDLREIIVLKIWAGMTFEQISLSLGIPMNTAASRYRYALQKLRQTERLRT